MHLKDEITQIKVDTSLKDGNVQTLKQAANVDVAIFLDVFRSKLMPF